MLGYTKQETMGQNLVQNFIQSENQKSVAEVLSKALQGQETANYELSLRSKNGEHYTVLLNATTRRDAEGNIKGVVGVGQDITELNMALAESKRVADDLTRLIDTANAPIFGIDTEGKVTEWNAKASSLLGFSKEEALNKSLVQNFITEEFKESVGKVLHSALNGQETANFEFPLFTANGERKEILLNATTRRGPSGEVIGVIGVGQDITQIREITKEHYRVADDLSRLIENANAPIFGVDKSGMVTEWNRKAADMLGYTKDETMGKHLVTAFIQTENRASVDGVLQRALTGEDTANYELPLMSKSGQLLTVLLNATTRRDSKGHIIGVVGVGQDITGLNALMAESQRVANDLTKLIETAHAPIFGINNEGRVTEWNRMMKNITEYSKEEALGKPLVSSFITEEYRDSVDDVLRSALKGIETANFEFPLFTKKLDRKIQILMSATPRRGPDEQIIGMIGVGQDITQLRAATEAADRTAGELSRLIDTANAPIFGVDSSLCITEWNQMMSKISGVPREEVMGKALMDWLSDPENKQSTAEIFKIALSGQETTNFELRFRRRSVTGQLAGQVVLLLSASIRMDVQRKPVGVVSIGQDITEHKALEDKKMRFMGVVSHELRSPIHGICGLSDAMATSEDDPRRLKQLKMIRNCSTRLLDLVNNIMDVSSIRSNALKLQKSPCDITSIIDETVQLLKHATDKRGKPVLKPTVQLINEISEGTIPIIQADTHRVTQVFFNLVMNALKFTMHGQITLSCRVQQDRNSIVVCVADTGIGISAINLDRIFEPFEQAGDDNVETRTFEGIGLGLSISREVMRCHGGDIYVESKVGEGSQFYVNLPIEHEDPPCIENASVGTETCSRSNTQNYETQSVTNLDAGTSQKRPSAMMSSTETEHTRDYRIPPPEHISPSKSLLQGPIFKEAPSPTRLNSDSDLKGLTVLAIDDVCSSLEMIRAALTPLGMEVITASSGAEALRILQNDTTPDLVVLDLLMPEMSGEQVLKQIRKECSMHQLPVIIVSAKMPAEEVELEVLRDGANDFLAKPFKDSMLRSRVRCLFNVRNYLNVQMSRGRADMFYDVTMPPHIADRLRKGEKKIGEFHSKVAVLYCNVVSIESLCKNVKTQKAIEVIGSLCELWDKLTDESGLTKQVAYGDAYMAVAGLDGTTNNVERLLVLALRMLQVVHQMQDNLKDPFMVRMALTTGPMTAGVVGKTHPRFCFFGETVNLSLRLENHGVPGCIHIDDGAHDELMHLFAGSHHDIQLPLDVSMVDRGRIDIRGRGLIHTWLLVPDKIKHQLPDILKGTSGQEEPAVQPSFPPERNFPRQTATRQSAYQTHTGLAKPASSALRMLSVDDDDINQEVIRGISDAEGFELTMAMDGQTCLQQIEKASKVGSLPDVLLLDCMMPGMSGMEVCSQLRESYSLLELPIVMLTCRSAPEELAAALRAGCNDYITKPFNRTELLARIRTQCAMKNCYLTALPDLPYRPPPLVPAVSIMDRQNNSTDEASSRKAEHVEMHSPPHPSEKRYSAAMQNYQHSARSEEESNISWNGLRERSIQLEILQKRVVSLRQEKDDLRRALREQQRQNVAMKAHLSATMTDVQDAWNKVASKEEELQQYKAAYEDIADDNKLRESTVI
eukprot:TRINITY_DN8097_c0_g3_i2.p1 TRINITY_DN8097_c0_g3~~TRINITY_DN8097_c0_g3_i2.p1  ORF type:complete len:1813 (-),score=330.93 TRINITY_DN8097_c0_g3_i2:209-5092(-)